MSKGGQACVHFLKWALPKRNMRWAGFKKVRGQVCSRINKRLKELDLEDYNTYKAYLKDHQKEWEVFDQMTHITISKFFRDYESWKHLGQEILPALAQKAFEEKRNLRCWSAVCASGEEPYTLAILWKKIIAPDFPALIPEIIATDVDEHMLKRSYRACYEAGSLKELPDQWIVGVFNKEDSEYCLNKDYKNMVDLLQQDIRQEMPEGLFDIIFCKNLVAMYFTKELAVKLFRKIAQKLRNGGFLLLGNHEAFPVKEVKGIGIYSKGLNIYRKV